jgi:acyl-CoA reductase-like NAD-dependent aldehyde dehydrogenase
LYTDELAELETLDHGMTVARSHAFLSLGIESLYYFAGSASLISGNPMPSPSTSFNYILREPVGVVGPTLHGIAHHHGLVEDRFRARCR